MAMTGEGQLKPWIFHLPQDALHLTASFLSTDDWLNFGQTSAAAVKIWKSVCHRVRLHGFQCATEIATAIRLGQFADARELAFTYVKAGVPCCYPLARGYALQTLLWRINIEAKHGSHASDEIDSFYFEVGERNENDDLVHGRDRPIGGLHEDVESSTHSRFQKTYFEEKAIWWKANKDNVGGVLEIHEHLYRQHLDDTPISTYTETSTISRDPCVVLAADFYPDKCRNKPRNTAFVEDSVKVYTCGTAGKSFDLRLLSERVRRFRKAGERALKSDRGDFDEIVLNFWDEIFPSTKGIHIFNGFSPIPRPPYIQDFVTSPCSALMGTVLCEIERIKTSSRYKGMKGRLFPTYDYVLFIRDGDLEPDGEDIQLNDEHGRSHFRPRRDTVLLVARNVGKRNGGSNNYTLSLPTTQDVKKHQERLGQRETLNMVEQPIGPNEETTYLGRLQSNFIGTEFQIFRPCTQEEESLYHSAKTAKNTPVDLALSDEELGESGFSSDASSRPSSPRFSRFSLRGLTSAAAQPTSAARPTRPRRNKIANFADDGGEVQKPEIEISAITYTATLLGSRPRIMDVCVPNVEKGETSSLAWFKSNEQDYEKSMLSCLKKLQENSRDRENDDEEERLDAAENDADFGLLSMQNRAPWWNNELGSFVLNFGGRVSVASVKNFQLCCPDDQEKVILQFGKVNGRHSFTMDYQHPLTALQAFAISITSLQSKITFG